MMARFEDRNRAIWEGHTFLFQDFTHTLGGFGLGFLLSSAAGERARTLGFAFLGLSALLHVYAFITSPAQSRRTPIAR
jgi:hypothetical protein